MKRLLSILLVLMLMLSMTATAFAADGRVDEPTPAGEVYVTKQYNDPVGHAATFNFVVTKPANAPTLTIDPIQYNETESRITKTSKLKFDFSSGGKVDVGEYSYTVKESQTGAINNEHEKLIMSKAEYRVDISVAKKTTGEFVVTSIAVYQTHDNAGKPLDKEVKVEPDGFKFENTYAKEAGFDDPEYGDNGSLKVSKAVINGNDPNKEFQFQFSYEPLAGGNPFTPKIVRSDGTIINLNSERTTPFKLKGGQWVKFTGFPVGLKVTVIEESHAGYTPSVVADFGGDPYIWNGQPENNTTVTHNLTNMSNTVDVTNTRNYTPPMGVILNVLPYVLMVAIAGGMIVLFTVMKRRKAQDYED